MTLAEQLREYVAAAFTGLWVQSYEHEDAIREIAELCRTETWSMGVWDVDSGLRLNGSTAANTSTDPVAAIKAINALATPKGSAILILPNFHRFLQSAEVVQCLAHQIQSGKTNRTFILVLAPLVQIPIELEKSFIVIDHDLPDRQQLRKIAEGIATEAGEMPEGVQLDRLLDSAAGLTRYEAEGAFSLSLIRHGKLQPDAVWSLKEGMLRKSGLLTLHRGGETFADLGGLDSLKSFCTRALNSTSQSARPRGILLLGVPGTGKSAFAKALGNETGRPTLVLDVGALMGGLVGSTEANTRTALKIADAMSPCILYVDEIEKALAGVGSSGQTDSGVSARLFGSLLTWLSDHATDVFFIATSNDVSKLPPEFSRAERFDGIFFLDLPSSEEKKKIWQQYLRRFELPEQKLPSDRNWTGAEIRSCCRLAALLDLSLIDAARHVVPVAVTAAESMEKLRNWASGRCLSASMPGLYLRADSPPAHPARNVSRPSNN